MLFFSLVFYFSAIPTSFLHLPLRKPKYFFLIYRDTKRIVKGERKKKVSENGANWSIREGGRNPVAFQREQIG